MMGRIRHAARDDHGAVAVLVAILALVIFGIAAFAVDFGNAYAVKRKLSVAADAAALAAAATVSSAVPPGAACDPAALEGAASSTARTVNAQNTHTDEATVTGVTVTCDDDTIEVAVDNQQPTPSFFGGIFGASGYLPSGSATAQVFVPSMLVAGLRPIAACADTVFDHLTPKSPFIIKIDKDSAVCGTVTSGDWGYVNFLNQGAYGNFNQSGTAAYYQGPSMECAGGSWQSGGNANCREDWIANGYAGPVTVPNLLAGPGGGLSAGNTGFEASTLSALDSLVGQVIQVPVVTRFQGNGVNAKADMVGILSVEVCAVKDKHGVQTDSGTSACGQPTPPSTDPDFGWWQSPKNNAAGLWVMPVDYLTSGVVGGPRGGCLLVAGCDTGTRAVRLYR
jgi:hypothetical protein